MIAAAHKLVPLWDRFPFLARLLLTASSALLIAGTVMLLVSARQEAVDSQVDLASELASELEILPATLAEVVVIGDFATLQQSLDRFVTRSNIYRVEYLDQAGARLLSKAPESPSNTPEWFVQIFKFSTISGKVPVNVGGRVYGELELELTAQEHARRAWARLLHHLGILVLAIALDFLGIWLVLRTGLSPLKNLELGADALGQGNLDTRLPVEGSPELRNLIAAFNRMADATQSAQKNLEASNAELQRFAEIAAHHLQEPARRLASYAQILKAQLSGISLDEDTQASLDFINQQARRQQALVRDVQRYLAAGQELNQFHKLATRETQPRRTDSNAILKEVLSRFSSRIKQIGGTVKQEDLPAVTLEPALLAEIFTLLLENILQHSQAALPVSAIDTPPSETANAVAGRPLLISIACAVHDDTAFFQISDNGCGINPEYHERVFRVFERLSSAGEGTGVGLAIVRRIVESEGERVWLDEPPGGGCRVNFKLKTVNPSAGAKP